MTVVHRGTGSVASGMDQAVQLAIIAAYFQRINALRQEIEAFEQRFDCRSDDFVARYERGEIEETMDTIRWFFRYEAYQRELEWQRSC